MAEREDGKYVKLEFDPDPSPQYPHGYWYAYAEPGYDAVGETVEATLMKLAIEMSEALTAKDRNG